MSWIHICIIELNSSNPLFLHIFPPWQNEPAPSRPWFYTIGQLTKTTSHTFCLSFPSTHVLFVQFITHVSQSLRTWQGRSVCLAVGASDEVTDWYYEVLASCLSAFTPSTPTFPAIVRGDNVITDLCLFWQIGWLSLFLRL